MHLYREQQVNRTVRSNMKLGMYVCVQVDGIFDKVGYDPAANSQVTRRAPAAGDAEQGGAPVGGGLPRIDLSTLLEKVRVLASPSTAKVERERKRAIYV